MEAADGGALVVVSDTNLVWRCLGGGVRRGETSKRED